MKAELLHMRSPWCLWIPHHHYFWMIEPMYIVAYESISTASVYVSLCVSFLSLLDKNSFLSQWGNDSVNTFPRQRIHATIEESFDACAWGSVYISFLVKSFPGQRRIIGGVICAVRVISKEIRRIVDPRTSCFKIGRLKCDLHKGNFLMYVCIPDINFIFVR
jgi:hypothetical protein